MNNAKDVGVWKKIRRNQSFKGSGSKSYHYSWDLNDGGSGFILYKKKRNRYKMYEDINGNGIRDKKDSVTFEDSSGKVQTVQDLGEEAFSAVSFSIFNLFNGFKKRIILTHPS